MTANELRQKYLNFFKSKGHTIIPSASLIPENDPTVLFTTAGMHPLVPYLLGEEHPGGKQLTSCQKCIRTGDIDEVGDDVHLTFFEMLGNWSLGDYWKEDAIKWSFEFLTKELGLPINKLAVTCFEGEEKNNIERDSESAVLWQSWGIPKERIAFLSRDDNWWGPAGITGPCGPDTEMFYWVGEESAPKIFDPKDKRWVEIWNDVFMQYNKTAEGKYELLKQKNVDTGMGLERTLAVLNGKSNVYETELFKPLIELIPDSAKLDIRRKRIIVDHLRAIAFLINDGVEPSNKEQGYVLRRLMRRIIAYWCVVRGFFTKPKEFFFLEDILQLIAQENSLDNNRINGVFGTEKQKFLKTIETGIVEYLKIRGADGQIDTKQAFYLHQSFGLPFDTIKELDPTRTKNLKREEFEEELKKHQELSRTASAGKFKGGLADNSEVVIKMHTATHLLHKALREVLGSHVEQKGSNITAERLRFDFSHPSKMTPEEISKVEQIVNEKIRADLQVHFEMLSVDEAKLRGAIGLFEEKYAKLGNQVKVYFIGDYSAEICGGPHVEHTSQIGSFKIIKEEAVAAGLRRIKAVVG